MSPCRGAGIRQGHLETVPGARSRDLDLLFLFFPILDQVLLEGLRYDYLDGDPMPGCVDSDLAPDWLWDSRGQRLKIFFVRHGLYFEREEDR